ncbi:hypothetical protein VTH06DRAFT_874 [Thermothelomyces fergusii]
MSSLAENIHLDMVCEALEPEEASAIDQIVKLHRGADAWRIQGRTTGDEPSDPCPNFPNASCTPGRGSRRYHHRNDHDSPRSIHRPQFIYYAD